MCIFLAFLEVYFMYNSPILNAWFDDIGNCIQLCNNQVTFITSECSLLPSLRSITSFNLRQPLISSLSPSCVASFTQYNAFVIHPFWHVSVVCSFLFLNINILFHGMTMSQFFFLIYQLNDICVFSGFDECSFVLNKYL